MLKCLDILTHFGCLKIGYFSRILLIEIPGVCSQRFRSTLVTFSSSCTVCAGGFLAVASLRRASTFSLCSSVVVVGDSILPELEAAGSTNFGHFRQSFFGDYFCIAGRTAYWKCAVNSSTCLQNTLKLHGTYPVFTVPCVLQARIFLHNFSTNGFILLQGRLRKDTFIESHYLSDKSSPVIWLTQFLIFDCQCHLTRKMSRHGEILNVKSSCFTAGFLNKSHFVILEFFSHTDIIYLFWTLRWRKSFFRFLNVIGILSHIHYFIL